jgi:phage antirepressor YoqD-like protein
MKMNGFNILSKPVVTMTSREIADLTGKEHKNVKADIRAMLFQLGEIDEVGLEFQRGVLLEGGLKFQRIYLDSMNREQTEYHLDRELTETLLTGYSAVLRRKVIARWRDLEGQVAGPMEFSTLQILDLARASELGRLAALEQVQQQQAQLAIAAPKVAFVDRYVVATGLKGFREVCKLLGANESRFREFLTDNKIMYRLAGSMTAHAQHLDAGRFEVRAGSSEVSGHAFNACKFTSKGVEWIAGEWAKHQIRAEVAA